MGTTSPCIGPQKGVGMTKGPEVVEQVLDGCPGDRLGLFWQSSSNVAVVMMLWRAP